MTAVAISLRHRVPRRAAVPFAAAGRLLRLELRRNVMIWVLPLLGALFWFDAYRTAMSYPAVWDLRASVIPDKMMIDFATFVAGASAWMGSRETRRHATDLVTTTGRPPTPGSLVRIAGENFTESLQIAFVTTVIGGSAPGQNDPETGNLAQQAVETVLLRQVAPELTNDTLGPPGSAAAVAAIGRFAALSAAERHAWLAGHLGALRAGRITLEELP